RSPAQGNDPRGGSGGAGARAARHGAAAGGAHLCRGGRLRAVVRRPSHDCRPSRWRRRGAGDVPRPGRRRGGARAGELHQRSRHRHAHQRPARGDRRGTGVRGRDAGADQLDQVDARPHHGRGVGDRGGRLRPGGGDRRGAADDGPGGPGERLRLRAEPGAPAPGGGGDEQRLCLRRQQRLDDLQEVRGVVTRSRGPTAACDRTRPAPAMKQQTAPLPQGPPTGAARRRRVVVTGAGVVSPLGDSPAALHRALAAGTSARKPVELFETSGIGCHEAGEIRPFDPQAYVGERNLRPLDRTSRLLVVAAQLALADSGWAAGGQLRQTGTPGGAAAEVGLVVGTTFCSVRTIAEFDRRALRLGPTHARPLDFANIGLNAATGQAAIWHGLRGVNSTLAGGEASGLQAIAQAAELVRAGRADAVLAGGAEGLCFESFLGYYRAGRLCGALDRGSAERPVPFDARRNGFSLSEGAALLMLEEASSAAARGAAMRAEVLGWGAAFAAASGEAGMADAVARAVRLALADAGAVPAEIGCPSAAGG